MEISYYVLADENDYVMPTEAYLTYGQKRSEVKWSAMAGKGEFLIVDRKTNFRVDDDTILSAGEYNDYAVRFYPDSSEGLESHMGYSEITLYVEKKELTVNALPVEKTYGEETKLDFTVDASKLVGEDTKADLGVVLTAIGTSGSEEEKIDGNRINSPVGTYDITMAQCNSANYDVTVVSSMLTIHPKEVSLSWSDVSNLVYSGNPVNVTAKAEGILEGDTCEVKVSNGQKIEPGTYQAIAVSLSNNNYKLSSEFSECVKEYTIKEASSTPGKPSTPGEPSTPDVPGNVNAPNMPDKNMNVPYTAKKVSDVTLPESWIWKDTDLSKELTVGESVTATAIYNGADKGSYVTEIAEITITRLACTHAGESEVRDAKEGSCTQKGYTGDTYCKDCGEKIKTGSETEALGHDYVGVVTKEATKDSEGIITYTCSRCGDSYTESIPKLPDTSTEEPQATGTPAPGTNTPAPSTNTPAPGTNTPAPSTNTPAPGTSTPVKGTVFTDSKSKSRYTVTKMGRDGLEVCYTKAANKNAKSVTIPATVKIDGTTFKVTSIADKTFANNKKLKKVVIGNNVVSVGKKAFYKCTKLKTVKLEKNVTTIGVGAFDKCTSLMKITIPSKVKKIGKQAFYGCKKLKTITIETVKLTGKNVGSKAFKGIYSKATIKVPKKKLTSYKKLLKAAGVDEKVKIKK